MRGKKRRDRVDRVKNRIEENKRFSDNPFKGLVKDLEDSGKSGEPVSPRFSPDRKAEQSDEDLFQRAMKDVIPLRDSKNKIVRSSVRKGKLPDRLPAHHRSVREYLSCLVKEPAAWDISFSDEYMEGAVSGVGSKIMRRLKRGEFSIQDHIDLHGLIRKEAEAVVNDFIIQSYQKGRRCVLIVHGRGLGSVDHEPALKKELPVWLRRGVLKKIVLAFVTARPCDGGPGASYILLRKR